MSFYWSNTREWLALIVSIINSINQTNTCTQMERNIIEKVKGQSYVMPNFQRWNVAKMVGQKMALENFAGSFSKKRAYLSAKWNGHFPREGDKIPPSRL